MSNENYRRARAAGFIFPFLYAVIVAAMGSFAIKDLVEGHTLTGVMAAVVAIIGLRKLYQSVLRWRRVAENQKLR